MNFLKKNDILYWTLEILAIGVLIIILSKLNFLLQPLSIFFKTVFTPIIIASFLFYLLHPITKLLENKFKLKHNLSVIVVYLLFLLVIISLIILTVPQLFNQITSMIKDVPNWADEIKKYMSDILNSEWLKKSNFKISINDIEKQITDKFSVNLQTFLNNVTNIFQFTTGIFINTITILIMLFYFLMDSHKFIPFISKHFFLKYGKQVDDLATKMNSTISNYISGQFVEALFVGISIAIGYLIIHQPFAILLALFAGIVNLIPYVGQFIGIIPSIIIALTIRPEQAIAVVIVVIIVSQIDGNLLYPNIIGRNLRIHPLTILVLLLSAGNIWGILGMILVVPTYAILKTIVIFAFDLYGIQQKEYKESISESIKRKKRG
ncbi:MAG: AI-2E family transporter [Lactobacillaceae bacterium]|jgi:predicted PurR-regulated permease PerM|nr:AI-2E family transporter [Lactobacillaceae bacterium]